MNTDNNYISVVIVFGKHPLRHNVHTQLKDFFKLIYKTLKSFRGKFLV